MSGLGNPDPLGLEVGATGVDVESAGENPGELDDAGCGLGNPDPFGFEVGTPAGFLNVEGVLDDAEGGEDGVGERESVDKVCGAGASV